MGQLEARTVIIWTPEMTFFATCVAAALMGLCVLLGENKDLRGWQGFRLIVSTLGINAGMGVGLGWMAYEYLGGKDDPLRVVAFGMLVGVRAIRLQDIRKYLLRLLSNGK